MTRRRKAQAHALGPPPGLGPPPLQEELAEREEAAPVPPPPPAPRPSAQRPADHPRSHSTHHHHPHPAHGRAILAAAALVWAAALAGGLFMATSPRFEMGRHAAPGGLLLRFDGWLRAGGPALALPALALRAAAGALRGRGGGGGGGGGGRRPTTGLASHHHALGATAVYVAASAARAGLYLPHREGLLGAAVEAVRQVGAAPAAAVAGAVDGLRSAAAVAAASHPSTTWAHTVTTLKAWAAAAKAASARHAGVHLMSDHLLLGALCAALLAAEAAVLGAEALAVRRGTHSSRAHALAVHVGLAAAVGLFVALAADMAVTAAHFHPPGETLAAAGVGAALFQAPVAAWVVRTWPKGGRGGGGQGGRRRRWKGKKRTGSGGEQ